MANTVDGSWTKTGNFSWTTFGSVPPLGLGWLSYKRKYLPLIDDGTDYGTEWAINMRIQNAALQDTYAASLRPNLHRGDENTDEGSFVLSNQATSTAGSATRTEVVTRISGVKTSFFLDWGYPGSEASFHNVTVASGGGSTILYVNGSKRYTYGFDTNIPSSTQTTHLGINSADIGSSFNIETWRHFSWLNYKPSDDEVINTIHPAMSGFNP